MEEKQLRFHILQEVALIWGKTIPDLLKLMHVYRKVALYKLTVGEDVRQAFLQWERFPLPEAAENFLESLSAYAELPPITDGYWKMVDRNPGTSAYTNVSLCVYDGATGAAYLLTMDI